MRWPASSRTRWPNAARVFLRGINLSSFLQLLNIERKTCTLNIRQGQQLATLIFQEGELVNARTEHREGEAAVYEVIGWSQPEIEMSGVVKKQPVNVHTPSTTCC